MTDTPEVTSSSQIVATKSVICETSAPFARLAVGKKVFDIAHPVGEADALAFREDRAAHFLTLPHGMSVGWKRIAADIILNEPLLLQHFLQTHAVRQKGWYQEGDCAEFDTLGTKWTVAKLNPVSAIVTFGSDEAVVVDLSPQNMAECREKPIELIISVIPDLRERFGVEIENWANRIAAGAVVSPII